MYSLIVGEASFCVMLEKRAINSCCFDIGARLTREKAKLYCTRLALHTEHIYRRSTRSTLLPSLLRSCSSPHGLFVASHYPSMSTAVNIALVGGGNFAKGAVSPRISSTCLSLSGSADRSLPSPAPPSYCPSTRIESGRGLQSLRSLGSLCSSGSERLPLRPLPRRLLRLSYLSRLFLRRSPRS